MRACVRTGKNKNKNKKGRAEECTREKNGVSCHMMHMTRDDTRSVEQQHCYSSSIIHITWYYMLYHHGTCMHTYHQVYRDHRVCLYEHYSAAVVYAATRILLVSYICLRYTHDTRMCVCVCLCVFMSISASGPLTDELVELTQGSFHDLLGLGLHGKLHDAVVPGQPCAGMLPLLELGCKKQ